jgi:hypothetical protein
MKRFYVRKLAWNFPLINYLKHNCKTPLYYTILILHDHIHSANQNSVFQRPISRKQTVTYRKYSQLMWFVSILYIYSVYKKGNAI